MFSVIQTPIFMLVMVLTTLILFLSKTVRFVVLLEELLLLGNQIPTFLLVLQFLVIPFMLLVELILPRTLL